MSTTTPDFFTPGTQLLVDHRGGRGMRDPALIEATVRQALKGTGTSILSSHFAERTDGAGLSGAVVLNGGHVAVQTWADENYASFDLFVPGDGHAKLVADRLAHALLPDWTQIKAVLRNDFTPLPPVP